MNVILETERLKLKELTLSDSTFILQLVNSEGWLRYIGDRNIHTEEQATAYLVNGPIKSYEANGFGLWCVALKSDETPIGICGIIKRDTLEHPDLGFAFLPEFAKKGYAYESASAAMRFARETLNLSILIAITVVDNIPSIALLKKLGFKNIPGDNKDLLTFTSEDRGNGY